MQRVISITDDYKTKITVKSMSVEHSLWPTVSNTQSIFDILCKNKQVLPSH